MKRKEILRFLLSLCILAYSFTAAFAADNVRPEPLLIQAQGSFAVGGTILAESGTFDPKNPMKPDGQTFHGDHAYVFHQVPVNPRALPIVFLHGAGQFSKTWETTPDGREGFQTSSCGADSPPTFWISLAAEARGEARCLWS